MRLNHNTASLSILREYSKNLVKQSSALEKISSGYKVSSAKDNPNTIAQSERLRIQIKGLQMVSRNVQDGVSLLQTADGGVENITSMLQRMRELAVQAQNGSNTDDEKQAIQVEISNLRQGIDTIANSTDMNGVNLINKDSSIQMAFGANVGETLDIPTFNLLSGSLKDSVLNKSVNDIDVTQPDGGKEAMSIVDSALDIVSEARNKFGAISNRLDTSTVSFQEITDKLESSESSIRDVDIAEEMMEYSRLNILVEAGNAMMVQSNKFPQDILRVLDKR